MRTQLKYHTRFTLLVLSSLFLVSGVVGSEHIPDCETEHFDEKTQEWICDQCDPGFNPGIGDTDCYPCPPGCLTCNFFDECQSCFTGFYLDQGSQVCNPCMQGCASCNSGTLNDYKAELESLKQESDAVREELESLAPEDKENREVLVSRMRQLEDNMEMAMMQIEKSMKERQMYLMKEQMMQQKKAEQLKAEEREQEKAEQLKREQSEQSEK